MRLMRECNFRRRMVITDHRASGHMHWNVIFFGLALCRLLIRFDGWFEFQNLCNLRRILLDNGFVPSLIRGSIDVVIPRSQ